ncbi:MAG TPA: hypothetical protein PKE45_22850, partial [Caldilineaceae bacterium]|nr:hypothetical protein [Caldilineaceae bacterium]
MLYRRTSGPGMLFSSAVAAVILVLLDLFIARSNPLNYSASPDRTLTQAHERSAPTPLPGAQVATEWFDLYLQLAKTTQGFSPPVAARAFGYAGVALYETVAPGFPAYQSLHGQLNGLVALPRPAQDRPVDW